MPKEFPTLASRLNSAGIATTGFCNNPLVGILQNGFKRGFERFYNYCGVIPSTPQKVKEDLWKPIRNLWTKYTQILRKLSYPIQNAFASPNEFFLAALRPLFVPLWTKAANFKGMTARSIRETAGFLNRIEQDGSGGHFVFLNLMETHMPYAPPDEYVRKFVPYFHESPEAQQFLHAFNRKAMQWLIPLEKPFTEVEAAALSDMYDAEVAYQDHLLSKLLEQVDTAYHRDHTMVIFLADHGEMLGEHGYIGHGFGLHDALIRVPLFIRLPQLKNARNIQKRVSITQLFYTILDYFGFETLSMPYAEEVDVSSQSLLQFSARYDCSPNYLISEAYPPENAIRIMRNHRPELIQRFNADHVHRAIYHEEEKLIAIDGITSLLYNLAGDPGEQHPYQDEERIENLSKVLDSYLELSASRQAGSSRKKISLGDELVQQRLRDLGYLE